MGLVNLLLAAATENVTQTGFNHKGNLLAHVSIYNRKGFRLHITQKVSATTKDLVFTNISALPSML